MNARAADLTRRPARLSRRSRIIVLAVVVVITGWWLIDSWPKWQTAWLIDDFQTELQETMSGTGWTASIDYTGIKSEAGITTLTKAIATINNDEFHLSIGADPLLIARTDDTVTLTSPNVFAVQMNDEQYFISADQPIRFVINGGENRTVEAAFPSPLKIEKLSGRERIAYRLAFADPVIRMEHGNAGDNWLMRANKLALHNRSIGKDTVTVSGALIDLKHRSATDTELASIVGKLQFANLDSMPNVDYNTPFSGIVESSWTGKDFPFGGMSPASPGRIALSRLLIYSKRFQTRGTGYITFVSPTEFPEINSAFVVKNLPAFWHSIGTLVPYDTQLISNAVRRLTGKPYEELFELTARITRVKGAPVMVNGKPVSTVWTGR